MARKPVQPTNADTQFAQAMRDIFRTASGRILHERLTTEAMTLSAVTMTGMRDQRATDINEGRRFLAVELLGAPNAIEGGK